MLFPKGSFSNQLYDRPDISKTQNYGVHGSYIFRKEYPSSPGDFIVYELNETTRCTFTANAISKPVILFRHQRP